MDCMGLVAYIDPGSGILIFQAIVAVAVGGLFSLGGVLRRHLGWPGRHKPIDHEGRCHETR
jgi:hypothetical protein